MKLQFVLLAMCLVSFCALAADTVDGSYAVELIPDKENKARGTDQTYPDVVTIKEGKFQTDVGKKQGFKETNCTVTVDGNTIKIVATQMGRGTSRFELELKDGVLGGKLTWDCLPGSNGEAKHAEYEIKGNKK